MKTTVRWTLSVGLALTGGFTGLSHTVAAASSETSPAITIHVRNYAGVAPKTLAEAEEVATGIFRKAGLETQWTDIVLTAENDQVNSADHPAFTISDIQLNIFPRVMSDHSGLPNNVIGLAPGTGPDRGIVYVFDTKVEAFFWRMLSAHCSGRMDRQISKAKILGHAIAHEVGHLLLNQQVHSVQGIMRGDWGLMEMRDAAYGMLLFTPQQAEVLRVDVRRRNTQQETLRVAGLESPALAR
jgi:hypothetical protein